MGRNLGNQIKPVCQERKGRNASVGATLVHFGLRDLLPLNGSGRPANQRDEHAAGIGRHFTNDGGLGRCRGQGCGNGL